MPLSRNISFDIIIPVFRPDESFARLLESLASQSLKPGNIFIINTEEKYWDNRLENEYPKLKVSHISKHDFDHGTARNSAAAQSKADALVFMTQDAVPRDEYTIEDLLKPIAEDEAEISYARQIPKKDADIIEKFTRRFNYPPQSRIKTKYDLEELGVKAFFCTNVCCAYVRRVFDELGGFPAPVILNEDSIFAARAINAGRRLSYTAEAGVIHSHSYSGIKQFHRNFDIGVSHAMHPEIFDKYPSEGEGMRLVKETMAYVCRNKKPWLVFKVLWLSGCKYIGYKSGRRYKKLSDKTIRRCTMNPAFWDRIKNNSEEADV